ncbi:hypothetical protein PN36_25650 [Candidatus Thiomargarita nelsonii]|uniref:Uncharacterized protein n=1 Tax=Candidatus Thiomargarita nelsonii TaxID=1003181 RepID=A0A0A6P547_9GAMM|nr:hypothetical protein PN36_25650 [Candidatus Thiomargarita nelsonii]
MFDQDEEFDVFWEILGGKSAPPNANPKTVAEFEAFREALFKVFQKESQYSSVPQPSLGDKIKALGDKIKEKFLSIDDFIVEGNLASCATETITAESPDNIEDDNHSLELYQDNEGTWLVSFQTFYHVADENVSIIITDGETEKVISQKLKYRDGGWQFDEPLHIYLDGQMTEKHSLSVKYLTKDDDK